MKRSTITMNFGAVLLCALCLLAGALRLEAQQLRADTVYPEFTVGPTGIRATIENLEVVVKGAVAGSPAASAGLQAGDILLSAQVVQTGEVRSFAGADPRVPLGEMIDLAEGANGQLAFEVRRGAGTISVPLTLPAIGGYGAVWPLGDAKSDTIVANLAAYIAGSQEADADYVFGGSTVGFKSLQAALASLFLLSTDDPAYLDEVRDHARALAASAETRSNAGGHICWQLGYQGILLAEYYLKTGDSQVLAGLEELCAWCIDAQAAGGWGHGASFSPGYVQSGLMNHPGTTILIALTLARECGVAVDDTGYNAAWKLWYRFAGRGSVPYGDHRPENGSSVNGRNAMLACALSLLDEPRYQAAAAETARMVADSYHAPESGHTGGGFNVIWRAIGAAHVSPGKLANYQRHMDRMAWMYDLCRQPDGSFQLLATPPNNSLYAGAVWGTGGLGLTYTAPRATLRMTGAPPTAHSVTNGAGKVVVNLPSIAWGTTADEVFFSSDHAAGFGSEVDEPHEVWQKLGDGSETVAWYGRHLRHYNPAVRLAAARKLAQINTAAAHAELAAAAGETDPRVRRAVFDALSFYETWGRPFNGSIPAAVISSTFLPQIVATLSNPDAAWWEIDGALFALGKAEPADIRANRGFIDQFAGHSEWYLREAAFWALVGVGGSITAEEFNKITDIYAASVHVFERNSMVPGFSKILGTAHSAFACDQRVDSVRTFGASFNTIPVPPGYVDRSADHEAVHRTMMILDDFDPEVHKYLVPDYARYLQTWEPGNQHADWLITGSTWQPGILSVLGTHLGAYGKPVVDELNRILAEYDSYPGGTTTQKQVIRDAVDLWENAYDSAAFPAPIGTPTLTAYYDFENDFDDAPGAGNSTDSLLGIGVSFSTDVPANGSTRSALFDGSSVLVSNAYSVDLGPDPDAYTIMFWVKAGDAAQPVADAPVISTRVLPAGGGAAEPAWQIDGPGSGGDPLTLRFNPGPCAGSNWVSPAATGSVAPTGAGAWHHVTFVVSNAGHPSFNGDAYSRTFVDGVEVGLDFESPWTDLRVGNSEGMLIIGGNTAGGGTSGFTGLLDDVALFSGVVADRDIAAIAAGTQSPGDPLQGPSLPNNGLPPMLGPAAATVITWDGALVQGDLQQSAGTVYLVWASDDQGASDLSTWATAPGGGSIELGTFPQDTALMHEITGLDMESGYFFRFRAENSNGVSWSAPGSFVTLPAIPPAAIITPVSAAATSAIDGNRGADQLVNGSGLSGGGDVLDQTHALTSGSTDYFLGAPAGNEIVFALPEASDVGFAFIWQYDRKNSSWNDRGFDSFAISFSTNGGASYGNTSTGYLARGDHLDGASSIPVQGVRFAPQAGVTHIKFHNITNFGDPSWIGLAEVRFGVGDPLNLDPPVLGTPMVNARFLDGAEVSCQLTQASATDTTLVWAYTDQGGSDVATWEAAPGGGSATLGAAGAGDLLTHSITGLGQGTAYVFRFRAVGAAATAWSPPGNFTTLVDGAGGSIITPAAVTATSSLAAYPIVNTINSSGLNSSATSTLDWTHVATPSKSNNYSWLGTKAGNVIIYQLSAPSTVGSLFYWSYWGGTASRSLTAFDISFSPDGVNYSTPSTITLGTPGSAAEFFSLGAHANVTHVRFSNLQNGGDSLAGIGEVRFGGDTTTPGDPYGTWAAGPWSGTLADDSPTLDFDGGGLETGIEWVVGGDPTDGSDDAGNAPTFDNGNATHFIFTFKRRDAAGTDASTDIAVQYGSNLNGWAEAVHGTDGVTIDDSTDLGGGFHQVNVSIPRALATGGKLFARLKVTVSTTP